jgi:quinol-cytochrome oxidoreductase complex cytochrome b subunit
MLSAVNLLFLTLLVFCAFSVVIAKHTVFSLLFLVYSFLLSLFLFLLSKCGVLALLFIVVYVGAIAVLFLFSIRIVGVFFLTMFRVVTFISFLVHFYLLLLVDKNRSIKNYPVYLVDTCIVIKGPILVSVLFIAITSTGFFSFVKAVLREGKNPNNLYSSYQIYAQALAIVTLFFLVIQVFSGIFVFFPGLLNSQFYPIAIILHTNVDSILFIPFYVLMWRSLYRGYFNSIEWYILSIPFLLLQLTADTGLSLKFYAHSSADKHAFYAAHVCFAFLFAMYFLSSLTPLKNLEFFNQMKPNNKHNNKSKFSLFMLFLIVYIIGILGTYMTILIFGHISYVSFGPSEKWYVLPFVGIGKTMPTGDFAGLTIGNIVALIAILILCFIPLLNTAKIRNTKNRPIFKFFFWIFIADLIVLVWVGLTPLTYSSLFIGQVATIYYFLFFLFIMPGVGVIENHLNKKK